MNEMDFGAWPEYAPHEIMPRLWQGGTEDDGVIGYPAPDNHYRMGAHDFDVVVTLYADAQPAPWGVEEMRFGFPDSNLSEFAIAKAVRLARAAHARWASGERVLIRCQAGVNRSGLVMALVLMLEGYTAEAAIAVIRRQRSPFVLSNRHFEQWLLAEAASRLSTDLSSAA